MPHPIAQRQAELAAVENLMREVVINTRRANEALSRENQALRKQNTRMRRVLRHECSECHRCPEQQKLVQDALGEALP
jgi:hypothetical protein